MGTLPYQRNTMEIYYRAKKKISAHPAAARKRQEELRPKRKADGMFGCSCPGVICIADSSSKGLVSIGKYTRFAAPADVEQI